MAGDGKEKKSKTKAKTDHDLTTDGGATRSTLSRLTSTVSNNKKALTLAGAAAAGVATAAGVAVALKRRKASLKTTEPESPEVSHATDLKAGQTVPLREV